MKKEIKITISGLTNTGKSSILYIIKDILKDKGFNVNLKSVDFDDDEHSFDKNISGRVDNIIEHIKDNVNITLEEKNVNRNLIERTITDEINILGPDSLKSFINNE